MKAIELDFDAASKSIEPSNKPAPHNKNNNQNSNISSQKQNRFKGRNLKQFGS